MTATIVGGAIAALAAALVGWWAKKGQDGTSAAQLAGKVIEQLDGRLARVEGVLDWHLQIGPMKDAYIVALQAHIIGGQPPPPPVAPTYPPRPA